MFKWLTDFIDRLFGGNQTDTTTPTTESNTPVSPQAATTITSIFGFNGNVSSGSLNYQNADFVNVIGGLNIDVIRSPGGIASNEWDWQNGCKENIPRGNRNNLDDLKAVVNRTGCKVIFTLNMITRSVQDQIEMLQTAQAKGISVKFIEMGNEMSNAGSAGLAKFKNGTNYAKECLIWYTAIKKVFPDVQIALWGENKDNLPTWVTDILKVFKPDALVTHIYPDASVFTNKGIVDTVKLGKMLDRSFVRSGLSNISIPIWVTETNVAPDSLNYLASGQHESALKYMLSYYEKKSEIKITCVHNIVGDNGAIADDLSLTETGRAFKSFKRA